jgi:2-phospho-L-lactate guanylyltransferase
MPAPAPSVGHAVVVPVKPPTHGKSRLQGLSDEHRRALATAFARDTVAAATTTPGVELVVVVTDDFRLAAEFAEDGCLVLPDGVSGDLNGTLRQAVAEVARRRPDLLPVALCADLPALSPDDLAAALAQLGDGPAFARDAGGEGTTMYAAPAGRFDPHFGPGSAAAHVAAGAREMSGALPTLRQDVDEVGDLGRALVLGVGRHTAAVSGRT